MAGHSLQERLFELFDQAGILTASSIINGAWLVACGKYGAMTATRRCSRYAKFLFESAQASKSEIAGLRGLC